jgi:hypothetical protein
LLLVVAGNPWHSLAFGSIILISPLSLHGNPPVSLNFLITLENEI